MGFTQMSLVILTERRGGTFRSLAEGKSKDLALGLRHMLCEIAFSPYGRRTCFFTFVQNDKHRGVFALRVIPNSHERLLQTLNISL